MKYSRLKDELNYIKRQKETYQSIVYFVASILGMGISILTVSLIVKATNAEFFGRYSLILLIVQTLSTLCSVGFTEAYSRILLHTKDQKTSQEVVGLGTILFTIQGVVLFLITFLLLPIIFLIYKDPLLIKLLTVINIFSWLQVFVNFFTYTAREINHMYWRASYELSRTLIFLFLIWIAIYHANVSIVLFVGLSTAASIIPIIIYLYCIHPAFTNIRQHWQTVKTEQKKFGIHIYIAQFFERFTFNLDSFMLAIYSYSFVSYYNLGNRLVKPMQLLSWSAADSYLKKQKDKHHVPAKLITLNIIWFIVYSAIILVASKYIILLFWGSEYLIIMSFLWILLLNTFFSNMYHLYYNLLYAKGLGKEIKKYFYIRGIINLVGNLALIPSYTIVGATVATLLSNVYFFYGLKKAYNDHLKNI